uniref:Putative ovule protein n=1 Tax=Solanum chacoense TaxID=4108 RepID=A0A0V0H058_SOLCH
MHPNITSFSLLEIGSACSHVGFIILAGMRKLLLHLQMQLGNWLPILKALYVVFCFLSMHIHFCMPVVII